MENNRDYLNRSIGTITSSRFGNETEGADRRKRLLNQANDAINKMDTKELEKIVPELQGKSRLK